MEKNQSQQAHLVPNNYHSEYIAHFSPLRTHLSITSTGRVGRRGGRRISDGRHLVLEEALPITLVLGKDLVVDGLGGLVLALSIGHQLTDGLGGLPGLVLVLLSSSIGADDESGEANDGGNTEPHDWVDLSVRCSGSVEERRDGDQTAPTAMMGTVRSAKGYEYSFTLPSPIL